MSIASGIAVYFLIWWVALFAVLPWGVRNAHEAGEDMVPGQANGAPVKTHLARKLLWTTLVATVLFLLHLANLHFGWLTIDHLVGS